jgi:restriction system protein
MPIPDFQTVMLPALKFFSDGLEHSTREAVAVLSDEFGLSEEERRQLLPSGKQETMLNRVGWSTTYLRKAGLLEQTRRPFSRITKRGLLVLSEQPLRIDMQYLERFPEYQKFKEVSRSENSESVNEAIGRISEQTPEEVLEYGHARLQQSLKQEILEQTKLCSPAFFENLVVELLVGMGYGGSFRDAAEVIGRSGDGGIDGIIKEDKLGLDMIYVQAKRWDGNVGRPEIQKFVGALAGHGAQKGVFITTSSFTQEALEYARNRVNNIKIVLIDGRQLAELMMDFNIGVATARVFEVKRLDSDYFTEE